VPKEIQAKLILSLLTPRAKTLVSRSSAKELADFLTAEYKLTPREYRARFNAATRNADETHVAFRVRLSNMWSFYMRSRECDDFEKLKDLIVADRLKDSLSPQCLKYCLGIEGHNLLSSKDLADLADVNDANYTADVDTEVVAPRIISPLNLDHSMGPNFPRRSCQSQVETAVVLLTIQMDKVIHVKGLQCPLVRLRAVCVGFVTVPIIVKETAHKNHETNQLLVNNKMVDLIVLNVNRASSTKPK